MGVLAPAQCGVHPAETLATRALQPALPRQAQPGDDDPPLVPNPAEVAQSFFVPFADLVRPPRFVSFEGLERPVIQLPILGENVHAPTAALLYQFAEVVLQDRPTRVEDLEQPPFAWQ